jgi:pre-60S factor REI1
VTASVTLKTNRKQSLEALQRRFRCVCRHTNYHNNLDHLLLFERKNSDRPDITMASVQSAAGMGAQQALSHQFTCNTCQVAYRTDLLQKNHMKSDWHRYNLKRRVASLPPIASEVFTEKVLQARAASTAEAEKATFTKPCEVCQKTYYSENSFRNHLSSQRHRTRRAALAKRQTEAGADENGSIVTSTFSLGDPLPSEAPNVDSDAEDEFVQVVEGLQQTSLTERASPVKRPSHPQPKEDADTDKGKRPDTEMAEAEAEAEAAAPTTELKTCLFCNYLSPTVPLNVHHMERFHGMFIPEKQYLVNLEGLLGHLRELVHEEFQCLYCSKYKGSAFAVQTHMRDTGHCKIPYTTEEQQLDIGEFYDFRSTYSDDEEDEEGEGDGGEDGGWETDSTTSSVATEDIGSIHEDKPRSSLVPKQKHHKADGWHSHAHKHAQAVYYDDCQLHLPSGKAVGHRSLNRYYRQNLHSHPLPEERAERLAIEAAKKADGMDVDGEDGKAVSDPRLKNRVRAVVPRGTLGMLGATDRQKAIARQAEKRGRSLERFYTKREDWRVGKVLNNHKSYYYRYNGGG